MSLAIRIIPVMLCRGASLVKGARFVNDRVVGHVLQAAKVHAARGVDELMILDVAATIEDRGPDLAMIEELTDGCFIPVTVGGGVRSLAQINTLLRAGADKVLVGAAATPQFIFDAAQKFGRQALVVAINHSGEFDPVEAAQQWSGVGAGELLLNDVDRDGTLRGYDVDLIRRVSAAVPVPVIACGGCAGYSDMLAAVEAGASAVAAGALFQFEDATPLEAAEYLKAHGREARCN